MRRHRPKKKNKCRAPFRIQDQLCNGEKEREKKIRRREREGNQSRRRCRRR
jgi:hypothetical protein